MYSFRYNPVYRRWVMVGPPVMPSEEVGTRHFVNPTRQGDFVVASYPRPILELEPRLDKLPTHPGRLHQDQASVGEYELLLYRGEKELWNWSQIIWADWLALLQLRVRQLHANLHLRYMRLELRTNLLGSYEDYQRVGDLIAASQPVFDDDPVLDYELNEKLCQDDLYALYIGKQGWLHVPAAPLFPKEMWYLPRQAGKGIDGLQKVEREELALVLSKIFHHLHNEWPEENYRLIIHTDFSHKENDLSWWAQIYQEPAGMNPLPARLAPEGFIYVMQRLLGRL